MLFGHLKITLGLPVLKAVALSPFARFSARVNAVMAKDIQHESIHPRATYAPWLSDGEFQTVYKAVRGNTLVDMYRCFSLWSLLAQAAKAGEGDILEVGVWRGGTGALLARRAKDLNLSGKTFLADTFKGVVKTGVKDAGYSDGEHADTSTAVVRGLCGSLGVSAEIIEGIFPEDRPKGMDERQFIFCHIDVDVYESGLSIFDWVWPRLKKGGIVVFDDHGFFRCAGITRLCEELKARHGLTHVYNLNGHGIFIKHG